MNASRCVVLYAKQVEKKKEPIAFETRSGVVMGKVVSGGVELQLNSPFKFPEERHIEVISSFRQQKVGGFFVNTGVPHFVIIQEEWNPEAWLTIAAEIQRHSEFLPQETNVTFMKIDSPKKVRAITFERGVRDYTLACGTGAVAAALTALSLSAQNEIEVTMPGGKLRFYSKNKKNFLRGPAVIVYKGELNLR
jgi:diaminopimelate epimerase